MGSHDLMGLGGLEVLCLDLVTGDRAAESRGKQHFALGAFGGAAGGAQSGHS